jgi:D-lactate dehydrogenase
MKVIVYSVRPYDKPALVRAAQGKHELIFTEEQLNASTVDYAKDCDAAAIFTSDDASAPVLDELYQRRVRYLLLRCVGYDHVDIEHATLLGISVANVPEYSPYSVAEHAVAMLLAMNRKLIEGQRLIALQDYRINTLKGFDIHGKTVGIIGTGKIGMAFARIMTGFGATVLATDPQKNQDALALGVRYVTLDELLRISDIVSIHCPLNELTRHLLGKEAFNLMKPNAIVINTSRGAVINTVDLIEALDNGKLGGACLDVYEFEKKLFFEDHRGDIIRDLNFTRLMSLKNVLITCHQGFLTEDAITEIAETTIANIDAFQNGICWKNQLNWRDDGKAEIESAVSTIQSL